jgi:ABC-type Fe3+ transport system substrate-binding protein
VLYPVAVVAGARRAALGQAYIDLLMSREGQSVLGRLGFLPPPVGTR